MKTPVDKCPVRKTQFIAAFLLLIVCTGFFLSGAIFLLHPDTKNIWDRGFLSPQTFTALDEAEKAVAYQSSYNNSVHMASLAKSSFKLATIACLSLALITLLYISTLRKYRRYWLQTRQPQRSQSQQTPTGE